MALSEITAVIDVSEPGCPRLAIHTVHSTVTNTFPLRLQFSGDIDLDDWTANLTSGIEAFVNILIIKKKTFY